MPSIKANKTITREDESFLANLIATRWLMFSEQVIASGESPAKLSEVVEGNVRGLYEPGCFLDGKKFVAARNERIAKLAICFAAEALKCGAHPSVLAHFKSRAA